MSIKDNRGMHCLTIHRQGIVFTVQYVLHCIDVFKYVEENIEGQIKKEQG